MIDMNACINWKVLLDEAQSIQAEMVEWRRELHQHPEIGFDLDYTKRFVKNKLIEFGCIPQDCGKAGIVVILGKPGGKTILLRGDMDALPVDEQADVPYRSQNPGKMHACGHDMHTAMMLGAAKLLKKHEDKLNGYVKLMYQPAEETLGGAKDMVDNGVLEAPHVDAGMMLHVMTGVPIPNGCIMIPEGGTGASSNDEFVITVKGKGGHGAMPNLSVDPINVMAHIHIALQEIHARELTPGDYLVITSGTFHAGSASNVIPDSAKMTGTIRTLDEKIAEFARNRIREISQAVATAFRAEVTVEYPLFCPSMIADNDMSIFARKYLSELLGSAVLPPAGGSRIGGGSEDFAHVSNLIPSIAIFLGAGNSADGYTYPQHHPQAVFDDSILYTGASAYAYFAARWLEDNI